MKVAALALVLIVASAVVLIFANTLNSWVLGGLIGGLAALLISIPVSLMIFTTLAKRRDEHLLVQVAGLNDDEAYDEYEQYDEYGRGYTEVYEAEAYVLPNQDEAYGEDAYDDGYGEFEDQRWQRLPESRRLPAPGQGYAPHGASAQQHPDGYATGYRRPTRALSDAQDRTRTPYAQHNAPQTGHQRQARQGQTTRSLRSQQQASALRAARREAEQEQIDNRGISVTSPRRATTPHHLPPQSAQLRRPQRREDTSAMPAPDPRRSRREVTGELRTREGQTDQLRGRHPTTGSLHVTPDTGKITRRPQVDEEYTTTETWTGGMQNQLVRRAPYLYEDDPLREQLAQQIEKPAVRRSSRYLHPEENK